MLSENSLRSDGSSSSKMPAAEQHFIRFRPVFAAFATNSPKIISRRMLSIARFNLFDSNWEAAVVDPLLSCRGVSTPTRR